MPYKIHCLNFYGNIQKNQPYYCITRKINSGEETNTYDLTLTDDKGNVSVEILGFEMVKLNQLAEEDRIADRVTYNAASVKQGEIML